jgi:hypothetical protein
MPWPAQALVMSRCILDSDEFEVVIGWDSPLQTFFVMVLDKKIDGEDYEKEVLWLGAGERIYHEPHELVDVVQRYAAAHDRLRLEHELTEDKRCNSQREYSIAFDLPANAKRERLRLVLKPRGTEFG